MVEYAVSLKIGKTEDLVLITTVTSDFGCAQSNLAAIKHDIDNGKYTSDTSAKLVMHEVTPWCEVAMKPVSYKWDREVTKGY